MMVFAYGITSAPTPRFVAGNSFWRRDAIAAISAFACATPTPGFSRAMT